MANRTFVAVLLAALTAGAGAAQDLPQAGDPTFQAAHRAMAARMGLAPTPGPARNVILFIADGAGPEVMTAIRLAAGQAAGGPGDDHVLSFEAFSYLALAKTWNTDAQTPDSAGTATAILSGVKTRKGVIGIGPEAIRGDCAGALAHPVATLGEIAEAQGFATGIVTTARLTHATPAAFYAHSANRDWEDDSAMPPGTDCADIARQLVSFPFEVALGGGTAHFLPSGGTGPGGASGMRMDGRNLIVEWEAGGRGRTLVRTAGELGAAAKNHPDQLLGLFSPQHMDFAADSAKGPDGPPSLAEMTRAAITLLARGDQRYLLLIEGGLIDPALHQRDLPRALIEGIEFDRAVAAAVELTDPAETLILVTSDHDHRMPAWARTERGAPVAGLGTWRAVDHPPEQGHVRHPPASLMDVVGLFLGKELPPEGPQGIGSHAPTDVAIYGRGPMAHLLGGTVEQTYVFHLVLRALGLDRTP